MRDELKELLYDVIDSGIDGELSRDDTVSLVAKVLDLVTPLPEPIDTVVDIAMEPLIERAVVAIEKAFRRDPVKLRARAADAEAKGRHKAAARLRRAAADLERR